MKKITDIARDLNEAEVKLDPKSYSGGVGFGSFGIREVNELINLFGKFDGKEITKVIDWQYKAEKITVVGKNADGMLATVNISLKPEKFSGMSGIRLDAVITSYKETE